MEIFLCTHAGTHTVWMGLPGSSGLPADSDLLSELVDCVSRSFCGLRDCRFHRRDGLVCDFLCDSHRGFSHWRDGDDLVVRRLADGLDRRPQGLDRLVERGLEVLGRAV